ncbi:hypothetical protein BOX15_Mlig023539g1 [Macrostomum lignano]|uniref:Golgi apparatus protein 1 n=2 Tax=Macrostomum lignano TaxID=282301 RepID=A0A1I8HBM7_9PLAT|nr:hypothetical protein BOX15_Mlig023539g1 [Macrostomum lignano]
MHATKIGLIIFGLLLCYLGFPVCAPPPPADEEAAVDSAAAAHRRKPARLDSPDAAAAQVRPTPRPKSRIVEAVAAADEGHDRRKDEKPSLKPPPARPKIKEAVDSAPAAPAAPAAASPRRSPWPKQLLSDSEACAATVRLLCSRSVLDNNFAVLDCLQRDQSVADRVPSACQHEIWQLKFNLTHNVKFDLAANGACQEDLQRLSDCNGLQPGQGLRVSCLIENSRKVRSPDCVALLRRLEPIVFSDFRLVRPFAKACSEDVQRLRCGRLGTQPSTEAEEVENSLPKSQGKTIACLSRRASDLGKSCRHQLLRLAELQSDDFQNDRQLFYACREDRERLCGDVTSGDGRVFSCLGRQAPDSLSGGCKKELQRVHSLMQYDYRVEHRFAQACQDDLKKHECDVGSEDDTKEHGMVRALLCLENAIMTQGAEAVDTECKRQMLKVRAEYLSEPELEPELKKKCSPQIEYCRKEESVHDQQLLHCIMRRVQEATDPDSVAECGAAVAKLLRVAMPTRNLQVDPVLTESCRGELDSKCARSEHKNGYVCLKTLVANEPESVGRECADRLAELEYFENRDFKLNDRLYRACRQPAASLCNASKDWFQTDRDQGYQPAAVVYNCLFHHMHRAGNSKVPQDCSKELIRSLEERASRVKLDPRLYGPCITDLSNRCMKDSGTGKEFRCLQDNLPELAESCRAAVRELTAAASRDIRLSPDAIMVRSCLPFAQAHCNKDSESADSTMECLIRLLKHPDMPEKCRAGVAHHQLIALDDVSFSYAFSQACGPTITGQCPGVATKKDAVRCLSEMVRNDTLTEQTQRVPAKCRAKLTFEMLQRGQSVDLDPRLQRACKADLESVCSDAADPLACLKDNVRSLSPRCHRVVFRRQKMQMDMPTYDARLMKRCRAMISQHCSEKAGNPTELFTCLRERMHDDDFDKRCRRVIYKRLRVQQTDYELNPELKRACRRDITKYCSKELKSAGDNRFKSTQDQLQDTVMQCLRRVSTEGKQPLRQRCHRYLRDILFEYNMNYRLEPRLARACKPVVQQLCQEEAADAEPETGAGGSLLGVTECLKRAAAQDKIPKEHAACRHEVLLLFKDMGADIHVDPVLYQACSFEIRNLCRGVPLGNGRQMSCAVSLFKDSQANQMISKRCRDRLKERVDLMEAAFKAAPPESLHDVMGQMSASPSRMYFLLVGLLLVLGLLVVGICAGRVTKRVQVDMKNR